DINQVNLGNPQLDPYLSDNIDLGFEYYTGQEGYFGFAAFRKGIEGFTQTLIQTVPFNSLTQYGITFESLNDNMKESIRLRGGADVATVQLRQLVNASGRLTINGL